MSVINKLEMLNKICRTYPGYRDCIVKTANDWISLDGKFMWGIMLGALSELIISNILNNNYDHIDNVFSLLEELIENGNPEVIALVTTELLEGMMNSRDLDKSLWRPLLGFRASEFCDQIDTFYD